MSTGRALSIVTSSQRTFEEGRKMHCFFSVTETFLQDGRVFDRFRIGRRLQDEHFVQTCVMLTLQFSGGGVFSFFPVQCLSPAQSGGPALEPYLFSSAAQLSIQLAQPFGNLGQRSLGSRANLLR